MASSQKFCYLPEGTRVLDREGNEHTLQKFVGGMCTHYQTDQTSFLGTDEIERVIACPRLNSTCRHLVGVMLENPDRLDEETIEVARALHGSFLSGASVEVGA